MCDCIKENEKRISEHYTEKLGVEAKATAKCVAIVFGETLSSKPFMPMMVKANVTGYRSEKGKEVSFFFNYCPWCGVKIEG